ncbi:MAG: phthalate 4,5-dioxygenase oxygenase subunit [Candidatus Poriferisodalaceae bacterium]|jgi:phthalate 4,5-dioxygenase oxygenase subunit
MLSAADNALLTRTNRDQPMGQYFRRFWQPVALSGELVEPDGPPVKVDILGDEYVAFRDSNGALGLLDAHCPHRGAHLYYGRNEDCGIRCVYHGWKFAVDGTAVDLPNVPSEAPMQQTMRVGSYPVVERGEFVWAYFGPAATPPAPPELEFTMVAPEHRYVTKQLIDCNWAQVMEGDLDTSHFSFLHMPAPSVPSNENPDAPADVKRLRMIRHDPMPSFTIKEHEVGFIVGGARVSDDDQHYWRITQFMLPSHGTGPSTLPGETYLGFTIVPINDEACFMFTYAWNPERPLAAEERERFATGHAVFAALGDDHRPIANRSNDFLIDRDEQKHRTYTGVKGLAEQDAMVTQSQGFIVDRTNENLTKTDAAIVRFRRCVLDGARSLAEGVEPEAPQKAELFQTRPGSWFTGRDVGFDDVLVERFGDEHGRVNTNHESDTA